MVSRPTWHTPAQLATTGRFPRSRRERASGRVTMYPSRYNDGLPPASPVNDHGGGVRIKSKVPSALL